MRTEEEIKTALSVMAKVNPISDAVLVLSWVLGEAPEMTSAQEQENAKLRRRTDQATICGSRSLVITAYIQKRGRGGFHAA